MQVDMFPVAILAGGLATRLRPITETIPKALVDVAGKPFIIRQLQYLHAQGVSEVVLCVGYLGEQIRGVVGQGDALGLQVKYSSDGFPLLGTGGALRKALSLLGNQFFVLYGDSYLPIDFREVQKAYLRSGQPALMTVLKNKGQWDKSNVLFTEGRLIEYNKSLSRPEMEHIDYGLSVISASAFDGYPLGQRFDLADLYHSLSIRGAMSGMEIYERFYEIGSPDGLKEADAYFRGAPSSDGGSCV